MGEWVPLFVAAIGAVAAIGVALWNSRGESAELRQLKAMNEVLAGLPDESTERKAFVVARDEVLLRVANRMTTAPARRRFALLVSASVVGLGVAATGVALIAPQLIREWPVVGAIVALIVAVIGVVAGYITARRSRTASEAAVEQTHRMQLELRDLRDDIDAARHQSTAIWDALGVVEERWRQRPTMN